jgi:hypothetical protein
MLQVGATGINQPITEIFCMLLPRSVLNQEREFAGFIKEGTNVSDYVT